MANLQIKNLPEEMHDELRRRAAEEGVSLRDYVVRLLRRDLDKPSLQEWRKSLEALPRTVLDRPVADYIREAREERDERIDRIFGERSS